MPAVCKACDACRIRRTKCDGLQPCSRCSTSEIKCSFNLHRRKRGRPGKTVLLLQDILGRESSPRGLVPVSTTLSAAESSSSASISPLAIASPMLASEWNHVSHGVESSSGGSIAGSSFASLSSVPSPFGQPFHINAETLNLQHDMITACVDAYMRDFHPLHPVVDEIAVRTRLHHREHLHNEAFAAMILTMSTLPMLLADGGSGSSKQAEKLLQDATRMHNTFNMALHPSLDSIATTMLMGSVFRLLKGYNAAYLKRKEALALVELLRLNDPGVYQNFTESERTSAVHIYWLLASSERSDALLFSRMTTSLNAGSISIRGKLLHLSSCLNLKTTVSLRLEPCVRLFELMDESLIGCIKGNCTVSDCSLDAATILNIHNTLDTVIVSSELSPVQNIDVHITRIWLHLSLWRACVSHSLLQLDSPHPQLRIAYPIDLLGSTALNLYVTPLDALLGNGKALHCKLLDIVIAAESVVNLPMLASAVDSVDYVERAKTLINEVRTMIDPLAEQQWTRWELSPLAMDTASHCLQLVT